MTIETLIVEDNFGDIELLRILLEDIEQPQYRLNEATSLQAALQHLVKENVDLVLLDLGLPDSHGLDTLKAVVKHHPGLPIVVLTGNHDERLGIAAVKAGAQDYLIKGQVTSHVLTRVLQYALERKQLQRSVQVSESQLRTILDALPSQVLLLDTNHKILWPNARACESCSLEREQIIGRNCYDLFHDDSCMPENCPFEKLCHQENNAVETESEIKMHSGDYIVTCTPLFNGDGNIEKVIHVATDITKSKQLQRELIQAHKMEAIGSLAGGIAHDFNNILSAVLGFSDLALRQTEGNEDLQDDLKQIYSAGMRARDLVKQILNFARMSDDELQPVRVDLIAKEVEKLLRSTLPSSIERLTNINSNAYVLANPVKIHQLFMNLCSNASHAMRDKGVLTIEIDDVAFSEEMTQIHSSLTPGRYQRICIADTGSGIPDAILEKIFEPFFTTKNIDEGTGMGLATVHTIVKECNGAIQVKSEVGSGTRFTILLPISDATDTDESGETSAVAGGGETLLLVDDEIPICKLGTRMLSRAGYKVVSEDSSEQALKIFSENPGKFDLVITDMTMPILSGDQLAQEILAIRADIPILLITGYSRQLDHEKMTQAGIRDYMSKPFEERILLEKVRTILDGEKS